MAKVFCAGSEAGKHLAGRRQQAATGGIGQSRLSHEQTPAGHVVLHGTRAGGPQRLPDVRWDVYALGAIFYRMLTGEPPFRSEDGTDIEEATDLAERLSRDQRLIRTSPTPSAHRRVPGMDRALSEVIERCLAVNPTKRFANVQAVLDALDAREESRVRRPLVLLGFVGPVLLLLIMALFAARGYDYAVRIRKISLRCGHTRPTICRQVCRPLDRSGNRTLSC